MGQQYSKCKLKKKTKREIYLQKIWTENLWTWNMINPMTVILENHGWAQKEEKIQKENKQF